VLPPDLVAAEAQGLCWRLRTGRDYPGKPLCRVEGGHGRAANLRAPAGLSIRVYFPVQAPGDTLRYGNFQHRPKPSHFGP
jgi:hypothetical protein